jgi:hypothetical protein
MGARGERLVMCNCFNTIGSPGALEHADLVPPVDGKLVLGPVREEYHIVCNMLSEASLTAPRCGVESRGVRFQGQDIRSVQEHPESTLH